MGKASRRTTPSAEGLAADAATAGMDASAELHERDERERAEMDKEGVRHDGGVPKVNDAPLTAAAKYRADWPGSERTSQVPGQEREPYDNDPYPRRSSQLAVGRETSASVIGSPESGAVLNYHVTSPQRDVIVQWGGGPVASMLNQHVSGQARVSEMDQAHASHPHMRDQLGDRAPMGISGAPRAMPEGTAGNYPGQATGPAPLPETPRVPGTHTDAGRTPFGDRDMARPVGIVPDQRPPGYEWTSRIPGSER